MVVQWTERQDQRSKPGNSVRACGFTLVELLVVLAILATLMSLAAPKYFETLDRAREAALRTDLRTLREAIDKYKADTGRFPESLTTLVQARYVYAIPVDAISDTADSWIVVASPDLDSPGVYDVRSGAAGVGRDGTPYNSW